MSVTGTRRGDSSAPADSTRTVAVCVPAGRPAGFTATVTRPAALPDAGVTDSQGASPDAVKESGPATALATSSVFAAGAGPLKLSAAGETSSTVAGVPEM